MVRPSRRSGPKDDESEVLLEFIQQGAYVKVAAIDPVTGTEVCVVGAASASEEHLSRTAAAKLRYVLRKQAAAEAQASPRRSGFKI